MITPTTERFDRLCDLLRLAPSLPYEEAEDALRAAARELELNTQLRAWFLCAMTDVLYEWRSDVTTPGTSLRTAGGPGRMAVGARGAGVTWEHGASRPSRP